MALGRSLKSLQIKVLLLFELLRERGTGMGNGIK